MRKHYVKFLSPGTFVAEQTTKPVDEWDPVRAAEIAKTIKERHSATPYGYQFITQIEAQPVSDGEGGWLDVQSKTVESSGIHYINGELVMYEDAEGTLRSNMRCNDYPVCVETRNSWRWTAPFNEGDVIVNDAGEIVKRGDDPELVEYRQERIEQFKAEIMP